MAEQDSNCVIISRKEARERGLKRYFTGKPCKRGHVAERYLANSQCKECLLAEWKAKHSPEVERRRAQDRREENPASFLEYSRKYNNANREKKNADARNRYDPKKAKAKAAKRPAVDKKRDQATYYKRHSTKRKAAARKWREENPCRVKVQYAEWRRKNPEKEKAKGHRRRARISGSGGNYTEADIFRIYKMQKGKCPYCGDPLGGKYQIDHITPISRGGSNHARNIQLLCAKGSGGCNQRKQAKDPIEFARSIGLLL